MANEEAGSGPFWGKPEWRGEEGYYKMLASSFADLVSSGEDKRRHLRCVARDTFVEGDYVSRYFLIPELFLWMVIVLAWGNV